LLKNQQNTASPSLTPSDDGKWSGKNVISTVSARRVPAPAPPKSSCREAAWKCVFYFLHWMPVVVINGGVRTCETYAALSVTVMLTRFPTLESILTSRSMVNL
jgi:hypothetical protein